MSREKDSWLSKAQHAALRRTDEAGAPTDELAALREEYIAADGHPNNCRYGWIHR